MAAVPSPAPARNFQYESVTFKVEGELYRVPRHGFIEFSEVFRTMFTLPQPTERNSTEEQNDHNPIELPSCTKMEFESLLEVLYPSAKPVSEELSKEQLIGVLKLSTQWAMDKIRAFSIEQLSKIPASAIERILLGRPYDVPKWLMAGCLALIDVQRCGPTSVEDIGERLGWETAARIMDLRVKAGPYPVLELSSNTPCRGCHRLPANVEYNSAAKLKTTPLACPTANCPLTFVRITKKVETDVPLAGQALKDAIKTAFPADFDTTPS